MGESLIIPGSSEKWEICIQWCLRLSISYKESCWNSRQSRLTGKSLLCRGLFSVYLWVRATWKQRPPVLAQPSYLLTRSCLLASGSAPGGLHFDSLWHSSPFNHCNWNSPDFSIHRCLCVSISWSFKRHHLHLDYLQSLLEVKLPIRVWERQAGSTLHNSRGILHADITWNCTCMGLIFQPIAARYLGKRCVF